VKRAHAFLITSALLTGCAASIQNNTKTQYVNETFSAENLRDGGMALFPVTAGQGQEGYRRPLGDFLNDSLQYAVPRGSVLTWQATMDSLNQHRAVDEYQHVIEAYAQTSIVDREKVKTLSEAVHVRYALFCALQRFEQLSKTSYSVWTGWSTANSADVMAHCLILDLRTGDVMQEIVGEAMSVGGSTYYNSPYEAYAKVLAQSVLSQIPGSSVKPPGTTRKPGTKSLHSR